MPNGHGGYVRFLSVIVLLIGLGGLLAAYYRDASPWLLYLGYGFSVVAGERLAHHVHRWHVEEYDGAYYSDEEKTSVGKTYRLAAVIYVLGAVVAWHFLTIF